MMTIRQHRKIKGMTQAEIAAALGVPQSNYSRWERGAIIPSVETLQKMAKAFGCQINDIAPAGGRIEFDVTSKLLKNIPSDWWNGKTEQDKNEIVDLLKKAYDYGVSYGRQHPL